VSSELLVVGAGMAGLAAAATARAEVREKGNRIGGSMLLSSGVVWRYREWDEFRRQCPDGDEALQSVVHDGVDEAIEWLESLGAPVVEHSTGNALTVGKRFDPRGLVEALAARAGDVSLSSPLAELPGGRPVVLATGGFQASRDTVRELITPEADGVLVRSNPWSTGDGLRMGLASGGSRSHGMEQFYGRAMPAVPELPASEWVASAQLYGRWADIENERGERYDGPLGWAETELVQWMARQPGARAWFAVPDSALDETTRYGPVRDLIERARRLGARVERRGERTAVEVVAAITQTLGGLRVDARGRVTDGVWAAGGDVGGVATGGYMSNLAAAVVMGRRAAEDALR
jgi:succinate dehydrogenase/fumarate reductase flavoprotein subunit